jgi:2-keto-4-pentenoate hydratase/2-oxohepta-3-ene-1,7-dioic acid hydratase in catechol pathway
MKLIRYLDHSGKIQYAAEQAGGAYLRVEGDPFGEKRVTQEPASVAKILAPVVPVIIWCIGQNYRRHADEVGMSSGDYPVVFAKGPNTLQDPGAPIAIPTRAGTAELD